MVLIVSMNDTAGPTIETTVRAYLGCESCGLSTCDGNCELIARLAADFIAADDCGCDGTGVVLVAEGGRWDDGVVERACECGGGVA
jgi:hypothetical protein